MSTLTTTRSLRDRMSKICSVLRDFDVTNNTRQFLYAMYRTRNRHCQTCSPIKRSGVCGPTCTLLSPMHHSPDPIDPVWLSNAQTDNQVFQHIVLDMQKHCHTASSQHVRKWEKAAEELRRCALSRLELGSEHNWSYLEPVMSHEGFYVGWTFETAWKRDTPKKRKRVKEESVERGRSKRICRT
jgi:hypothetical protein